jgi:hypothetical protein
VVKTTVEVSDPLIREVRDYCVRRGISFRQVVEAGLRLAIADQKATKRFRLKPFGFKGDGQIVTDWAAVRETIYEGRGGAPDESGRHSR